MQKYETTFIIDSLIKPEEIEGIISKIEKFISNNGGQIDSIDRWGKKRLAYEIKKRQYGYYVYIKYLASNNKLNKLLEREYKLDENILRYLTLIVDPRTEIEIPKSDAPSQDEKPTSDDSEPIKKEEEAAANSTEDVEVVSSSDSEETAVVEEDVPPPTGEEEDK